MKLPFHIETAAEYHCRRILERLNKQEEKKNVIRTEIPRIKHALSD